MALLADLGADVVRVQRGGHSAGTAQMRGHRIVVADLKDRDQLAAVRRLIDRADVLVEGFRPGVTERLGIGPDDACPRNPRLVYARVTGWGQSGPRSRRAGHDINYTSLTGLLHAMGPPDRPPFPPLNLGFFAELLRVLGIHPDAVGPQRDREGWPIMRKLFAEKFMSRSREAWAEVFAGTDACVTPVLTLTESMADPHLSARGVFVEVDGVPQPAPAPRLSRTPAVPRPASVEAERLDTVWI